MAHTHTHTHTLLPALTYMRDLRTLGVEERRINEQFAKLAFFHVLRGQDGASGREEAARIGAPPRRYDRRNCFALECVHVFELRQAAGY